MDLDQHKAETLAAAIQQREEEVFGYQFNIGNFERMLAKLPPDWTCEARDMQKRERVTDDEALEVGRHLLRDDLRARLIAERVQLQTAALVLEVLREQTPT